MRALFRQFFATHFVVLVAIVLASYAGPNLGFLSIAHAASDQDESVIVSVPFLTLRNKTGRTKLSNYYGDDRGPQSSGYCDVEQAPYKFLLPFQPLVKRASFHIPEDKFTLRDIRSGETAAMWDQLENAAEGKNPLLYTHGYFMSFERSCKRAAMLGQNLGLANRLMFFSWPSDGAVLNYTRDESDLYWSVAALENTLSEMIDRFGAGNTDLAAHSLGSRALFLATVHIAMVKAPTEPLFDNLVLLAPDMDADIFGQYLPLLRKAVRNITIYVSDSDRPLALSRTVHGQPRLGEAGPHLETLSSVTIVDISDVMAQSPSGHVYHIYNDAVADDLYQLLNEKLSAAERSTVVQAGKNYWKLLPAK